MVTGRRGGGGTIYARQRRLRGGGAKSTAQLPAAVPSVTSQPGESDAIERGPKPVTQPPAAVPSRNRTPT